MDDERDKHPICDKCRDQKLPTTYLCGVDCPGNPGAWEMHGAFHKKEKRQRKRTDDGGVSQQHNREAAERAARHAAQSGDEWDELMAEGARYASKQDWRRAARTNREATALKPDKPAAYMNLGTVLTKSGHLVEAAQRYLEAGERYPAGSENWACATAQAFDQLRQKKFAEGAKPEWWDDEGLKALSAMVVRAAPNDGTAVFMRAYVLCGGNGAWEAGSTSAAELREAAEHFDRSAALSDAPTLKAEKARLAGVCRSLAQAR